MENRAFNNFFSVFRIAMGWLFLWPFLDKLFGLGIPTAADQSWLAGTSPALGFLKFGTKGPFAPVFQSMAGSPVVDALYMFGLLLIGAALFFGIGVRIAGYSGALMMLLIYLASALPPEHNPVVDEHIIFILALISFTLVPAGDYLGFGRRWSQTRLVQRFPILK